MMMLSVLVLSTLLRFSFSAKPDVVFIVADDLGFGDCSFTGVSDVRTPHIDALAQNGLRMTRYYGQPVCSPSRAAIHTGRLPLSYGLQTYVIDPTGVDYGLNLNETTLPQLLRDKGGYDTHAVGKWHLGMSAWEYTPTFRGYNSFHGFYSGGQDYFSHTADGGYDMHIDASPRCGADCSVVDWSAKGVYSTHLYAESAIKIIASHDHSSPLFLYLAFQAVHSPDQVPVSYIDPYNATIPDLKRRTFAGMLSCLDEAVGNVTAALAANGFSDVLIVFVADNGGPIFCKDGPCGDATGTSNYPLRGGKHSLWEGGTRLTALVSGPLVHAHGVNETGLMHHADWLPTLLDAAGIDYTPAPGFELHGASQWPMITSGAPSSRNETVTNIDPLQPAVGAGPPGQGNAAIITAEGWKLLLGLVGPPDSWSPPNASKVDEASASAHHHETATSINCSVALEWGTCFPGHDLLSKKVQSPSDCCSLCSSTKDCVSFTYRTDTSLCYVKSAPNTSTHDSACVSGGLAPKAFAVWPLTNMTAQLYNLNVDPWERDDVAAEHPDIVATLTARLAQWGVSAKDPYFRWDSAVDPKGNPANPGRNGSWFPWLD
jgi:arylsulfatase B